MYLRLTLALSMFAPPTEEAAQAAYNSGDLTRALEMYLELAEAPGAHPPQALDGAHASLRALHRKEQDVAYLCRARELARELLKRSTFASDHERAAWVELEAEDTGELHRLGAECPADGSVDDEENAEKTPSVELTATPEGAVVVAEAPLHNPPEVKPEGPPRSTPVPENSPPRRPVGRLVGGSFAAAVGVGLLGGMAGALVRRAQANDMIADLATHAAAEDRPPTSAELAEAASLNRLYERHGTIATVLGIAGSVSLITALAVFLAPPRAASRARVRAAGAGLVYSF